MSELLVEKKGHVAVITLNRPERMNAISASMLRSFSEQLLALDKDSEVRCIIVTGAGKGFCAGLDLKGVSDGSGIGGAAGTVGMTTLDIREAHPVMLHEINTPVVCALNGGAAGYGMDLALGCDIRIASDKSKLAPAFTRRGVVPESGGTWLLPRMIGWAKASEIFFTGKTLSAEKCLELGLVNKVVSASSLMDEAMAMAEEISGSAPLAVQATKRMMRAGLSEQFPDHVHHVFLQILPLFQTDDFKEGMMAFLEKRDPDFKGH